MEKKAEELKLNVETEGLDEAIEKARILHQTLEDAFALSTTYEVGMSVRKCEECQTMDTAMRVMRALQFMYSNGCAGITNGVNFAVR